MSHTGDLLWFHSHQEAAFGYSSAQSALPCQINYGIQHHTDPDPYTDAVMCHVRRARRIQQRLHAIDLRLRRVLEATYCTEYRFPEPIQYIFGRHTGALLVSCTLPPDELTAICIKIKKQHQRAEDKLLVFTLRVEAERLYRQAHDAYTAAGSQ